MSNHIQFDLASPQKLVYSKPVAMVLIPGSEGVYGVLPGHASMDTGVSMGVVEVFEESQEVVSERLFVVGGFCEVTADYCTLMADEVVPVKNLKREALEEEIRNLKVQEDSEEIERKLAIAHSKLLAIA